MPRQFDIKKRTALRFVILIGIVSLFSDMTYEGARSITGPYLAVLGANATVVGFVVGFGELMGYALRVVSGYLADRTQRYWLIAIVGYFCNLLAVPLLALAGHWWVAAILIIIERMGKALRVPPRDAMLSHAGQKSGMGWIFGLHEALDQTGAMLGPLLIALVLFLHGSYQQAFACLLIPAIVALTLLLTARVLYPHPQQLEIEQNTFHSQGINVTFWWYLAGAALIAAGYLDYPLIAYHFQKTGVLSPLWIPVAYAIAKGANTVFAPLLGHCYDHRGFRVLLIVTAMTCFFAPLIFFGNITLIFIGVVLWSIGVSAHESLMRAIVANMVPMQKRASAYGIFNLAYGVSWFLGSFLMGYLYDISIPILVGFSVIIQLLALPLLWIVMQKLK